MRLLFCCETYYPAGGGVAEVMRQIAERMAQAGHDVTVVTQHHEARDFDTLHGVHVRGFKVEGNLVRGLSGEVDRYRDFVLRFEADAILIKAAQQWTFDSLWPILDRIRARKVFVPCGFSGLYESAYADYFAEMPQVLAKFDHLIFYAEKYRDIDFAREHGLNHLSIVPNGANELEFDAPPSADFRLALGISDTDFVFLSVGNPIHTKGHGTIAEAFSRLDIGERSATLILNGDWPRSEGRVARGSVTQEVRVARGRAFIEGSALRARGIAQRLVQALRRRGIAGFVELTRARRQLRRALQLTDHWVDRANSQPGKRVLRTTLPRADLVKAYLCCDLFVFASMVEYSPLVLFEAAAAGKPFLSIPVGNAGEIARWTGGGVICPASTDECGYSRVDPAVLAEAMRQCMDEPDELARLGATAKARWRRDFTWQAIAPRYEAILAGRVDGELPRMTAG